MNEEKEIGIVIIGCSGSGNNSISKALLKAALPCVRFAVLDNSNTGKILAVDDDLINLPTVIDLPEDFSQKMQCDNSFRGGSRGKGGKIKYRRS